MTSRAVYMDNNSTTPVDPRVLEAMLPYFTDDFGNAASRTHGFGWAAEKAVETGREQVARLIGAKAKDIIFTSGATESDNLAVRGAVEFYRDKGNHVITQVTEHKAILDTCRALERKGLATVTYLPVDQYGRVDPEDVRKAMTDKTVLVTIMFANNEIGTVQPLAEIGKITRERGVRSGTLNVPGIVGLGMACELSRDGMADEAQRTLRLREKLREGLFSQLDEIYLNGHPTHRLPGNLNVSFAFVEGESLLMGLNGSVHPIAASASLPPIAVSSGSACTSATLEPSYILKALGVGDDLAHTSIRFGIGRFNTDEDVDYVIERVVSEVRRLRDLSPLYEMAKEGIDLKSVAWQRE